MRNPEFPRLSSRSIPGVTLGVALLLMLTAGLVWAPPVEAQTACSALITLAPDKGQNPPGDVLDPNEVVNVAVSIFQACLTGGVPVTATVKGTTRVDLACATANNLTDPSGTGCAAVEQLNTLHFDSCTPAAADVSCVSFPSCTTPRLPFPPSSANCSPGN